MASRKTNSKGTALVTGGAQRIGRALCLALASWGYKIAINYNSSKKEAETLSQEIQKQNGTCKIFPCNLSNESETANLIKNVHQSFPDLSLLINSASVFEHSSLRQLNLDDYHKNISLHVTAPLILCRDFANLAKKGQIINILDTHITQNKTPHFLYLLSKKCLYELTKMAAVELAPDIRVNGIAPGLILPPKGKENAYLDRLAQKIPLQRKGEPANIVQAVEFLLNNPYVTGQVIFVDGGEHLL